MRKRAFSLLLAMVMCLALLPATASALTDGTFEYSIKDNQVTINQYVGSRGSDVDIVIPAAINGCPVTTIGRHSGYGAFEFVEAHSVTMPDTVTTLESRAFMGLTASSIHISETLQTVGDNVFEYSHIAQIEFPDTVTSIGSGVFSSSELTSFRMPAGLKEIPDYTFSSTPLETVVLNQGLESIGVGAFSGCESLKEVQIPSSVKNIRHDAFNSCKSMTSVNIPDGVQELEYATFYHCEALTQILIPRTVTKISDCVFYGCSSLVTLMIPNTVTSMGSVTDYCTNLETLTIPSSVAKGSLETGVDTPKMIVYVKDGSYAHQKCNTKERLSVITDPSVDSDIQVLYNRRRISFGAYGQNPEIINSRTMVPLRSIFEAMGAEIAWDAATQTVTATRGSDKIVMTVGQLDYTVNGVAKTMDIGPSILNSRTMVPVRVVAESFGADVTWHAPSATVIINE